MSVIGYVRNEHEGLPVFDPPFMWGSLPPSRGLHGATYRPVYDRPPGSVWGERELTLLAQEVIRASSNIKPGDDISPVRDLLRERLVGAENLIKSRVTGVVYYNTAPVVRRLIVSSPGAVVVTVNGAPAERHPLGGYVVPPGREYSVRASDVTAWYELDERLDPNDLKPY